MKKAIAMIIMGIMVLQVFSILAVSVSAEIYDDFLGSELDGIVPGEIIVKFKAGVGNNEVSKIHARHGVSVIHKSNLAGFHRLRIPKGKTVSEMIEMYKKNPNVEYVEPNYIARACMIPNDPYYSYQWHLHGTDAGGIDMEPAWDISTGSGAVVAIIDTGISVGTDLADTCFVSGYDFVNNDNDPVDDNGHGTHVAGTVAQSTNNNVGVTGVAFNACLMPIKVLDSLGYGTYADIIDGINFATNNGANIISMSLEGSSPSQGLENALANAYNNGVTCVAASGNSGQNGVAYPAAYGSYVIAVGATQYDKTRAPYSNYGTSLDVVAPGGNLNLDQNNDGYADGVLQQTFSGSSWGYYFYQGTSMATPHVSGVAALLCSTGVTSPDDIRNTIQSTAVDLGSSGWDIYYGYGLVNAYDALQYTPGDNPPTCSITSPTNGATVSGTVNIEASASDDVGVVQVDFYVDSTYLGTDTDEPYSWSWDSTTADDGSHTITATAIDTANQSSSDSISVTVDNVNDPPIADAGSDQNAYVDELVEFDGSGSYDTDGSIVLYEWDFGDGSPTVNGITVFHAYSAVGTYTVTLTVTDDGGLTASDQAIVTVEEAPLETVEFSDSFEVGEWNGLWAEDSQNDWFRSTQRATDESYSAEVDGFAFDATLTMADAIDLSGKTSATLTFSWFIESSWDSGEYIALDVFDGTWYEVKRLRGNVDPENVWHHETIDLSSYMVSGFKIRFRAKVSRSNEDGNVDNVKIISVGGEPNAPPDAPTTPIPADGATDVGVGPTLSVDVFDPDDNAMDVTFHDASDNSIIGTDTNVPSGGTATITWSGLDYETTYNWYAVADDGIDSTQSATWTFTTESAPPNNPPVADDQSTTTEEDTAIDIILTASDPDGDPLTYSIVGNPSHGSLSGDAPSVTYTPDANYYGSDSFTFKANDGLTDSNLATVTITVTSINDAPVADDQPVTTTEDTSLDITLTANDADGDSLTYTIVSNPSHGTLTGNAPSVTYTPDTGYTGGDSFTFKANDGEEDSNIATVTITINPATPTMHVGNIEMSTETQTYWRWTRTRALATVTIVDSSNNPVEDAAVSGHWSGLTSDSDTGTTNNNGEVTLYSNWVWNAQGTFTFTVDNVEKSGWTYDESANVETSDSIIV